MLPSVSAASANSSARAHWRRLGRAVLIVVLLELGLLLLVVPWTGVWRNNYFLLHSASLSAWALSPFCRGAVSGLGLLNLWFGTGELGQFRSPR